MIVEEKKIILKNKTQVLLRSPFSDEADRLLAHLQQTALESYQNLNQSAEYWSQVTTAEEQKILEDFRLSKTKFMIVTVDEDEIVGGLGVVGSMAGFSRHSATLGMSVQQAYCGLGVGTELVRHAISSAKKFGFTRLDLTVRTYNEPGIKLYEKTGFERIGLLKNAAKIDGQYVDEFSYQLLLK